MNIKTSLEFNTKLYSEAHGENYGEQEGGREGERGEYLLLISQLEKLPLITNLMAFLV